VFVKAQMSASRRFNTSLRLGFLLPKVCSAFQAVPSVVSKERRESIGPQFLRLRSA